MEFFLLILAGIWLIIASIQDIKIREVPNWLSFSLIAFALSYRAFFSVLNKDLWFLLYGLIGFGIFFLLAYLFYYARVFAGGDAKLLMGLGVILPLSSDLYFNLPLLGVFIFLLLLVGGVYGLLCSFILVRLNRRKFADKFAEEMRNRKGLVFGSLIPAILSFAFVVYTNEQLFFVFPLIILLFPFLFIYAKAVESFMIKTVSPDKIAVGDWLNKKVKVGKKVIEPYWEGLSEQEVKLIKKYKKNIEIKQGIPFVPAFLVSFILLLILRYSSWGFFKFLNF